MLKTATVNSSTLSAVAPIRPLLEMCVRGLEAMLDPERNLFCHKVTACAEGLAKQGISPRYTMIALMGLQQAEQIGLSPSFDSRSICEGLVRETRWIDNAGDWGLLLWMCAIRAPEMLPHLAVRAGLDSLLARFRDAGERRTMEMAWVLAGLSHMRLAGAVGPRILSSLAFRIYRLMIQNQGVEGLFGHQAESRSSTGRFRARLGSFADQVYPIYALSKFAQAWEVGEAVRRARRCADALCCAQGPMGQWWWHYDSATGRAVGRYPVYSVHQDGMAPMALFALSEVSGASYDRAVYRGLEWIYGANELGVDMRDFSKNVIWRCIRQSAFKKYSSQLLAMAKLPYLNGGLKILRECRPYHLGWLLYALASQQAATPGRSTSGRGLMPEGQVDGPVSQACAEYKHHPTMS